jgi:hypothetical protein
VTTLSQKDIAEKLDGKKAKAAPVEVTLEPGPASVTHRYPGPVFGNVSGSLKVLKAFRGKVQF